MYYWSSDWWWGLPLLVLTVVFHVCVFVLIVKALVLKVRPGKGVRTLAHFIVAIALTALGAAVLHSLEAAAWGILYIWVGAISRCAHVHVVFAQRDHKLRSFQYLPRGSLETSWRHRGNERANSIWADDRVPFCRD